MSGRSEVVRRFLDGELDGAEREALARVRAERPDLDEELSSLARIKGALGDQRDRIAAPDDLADRVMATVADRPHRRRGRLGRRAISLWPAGALALLLFLLATAPYARRHRASEPPLPAPAAEKRLLK